MNHWLDISLVTVAVIISVMYAAYALGPKRLRDACTRWVTKYFGLRAAKLFSGKKGCDDCAGIAQAPRTKFPATKFSPKVIDSKSKS